jgi:uncharacterized protein involved in propanediol utilization
MLQETLSSLEMESSSALLRNDTHFPFCSIAMGMAYGTFGELLQGVLPDENHFLVTFPINSLSKSIIIPDADHSKLDIYPKHKKKSLQLANAILKYFNVKLTGKLIIKSDLEEGKGLASSSADMVATARAISLILNRPIPTDMLLDILRQIEPSDGVMYPGIVSFYHRKVALHRQLGTLSGMTVIAIDEGGEIDTVQYNKKERHFAENKKLAYQSLLDQMADAIAQHDLSIIGNISTQSAVMNQPYNPKKHLDDMIAICERINGLGVIIAHSGTYIGILIANNDVQFDIKIEQAIRHISKITCNFKLYESVNVDNQMNGFNSIYQNI